MDLKHRKESKIMKLKEQQLLLKELCARSPYGVKVVYLATTYSIQYVDSKFDEVKLEGMPHTVGIGHIKPYLRPMSSMTEEETEIFNSDFGGIGDGYNSTEIKRIDWLNANHFDYRASIDRGLALEAPEGIYK